MVTDAHRPCQIKNDSRQGPDRNQSLTTLPIINAMTSRSPRKSTRIRRDSRDAGAKPAGVRLPPPSSYEDSSAPEPMDAMEVHGGGLVAGSSAFMLSGLPALHFGFVYDDHLQIESNPQLQSWSALGQALHEPLWTQLGPEKASPYFRPLFLLVLFVQHMLFGSNPAPWHLVSMSLHSSCHAGAVFISIPALWPTTTGMDCSQQSLSVHR